MEQYENELCDSEKLDEDAFHLDIVLVQVIYIEINIQLRALSFKSIASLDAAATVDYWQLINQRRALKLSYMAILQIKGNMEGSFQDVPI